MMDTGQANVRFGVPYYTLGGILKRTKMTGDLWHGVINFFFPGTALAFAIIFKVAEDNKWTYNGERFGFYRFSNHIHFFNIFRKYVIGFWLPE